MCGGAALAFDDRPDLEERVRTFWGDTDDETSFTEMHILAHYAGALDATNPDMLWAMAHCPKLSSRGPDVQITTGRTLAFFVCAPSDATDSG